MRAMTEGTVVTMPEGMVNGDFTPRPASPVLDKPSMMDSNSELIAELFRSVDALKSESRPRGWSRLGHNCRILTQDSARRVRNFRRAPPSAYVLSVLRFSTEKKQRVSRLGTITDLKVQRRRLNSA